LKFDSVSGFKASHFLAVAYRSGLGDGREFEIRPPVTEADLKIKVEDNN